MKEVYFILFNKYYLQLAIPLLLVYNFCNIYKTFILIISLQFPLIISQLLNLHLINSINDVSEINNEMLYTTGYSLVLCEILFNSDTDQKLFNSYKSLDSIRKNPTVKKFSFILEII